MSRLSNGNIKMTPQELRADLLENSMKVLKNVSTFYRQGSPAWVLIQNAWGHINSVHHLETKSGIDAETLGVKDE